VPAEVLPTEPLGAVALETSKINQLSEAKIHTGLNQKTNATHDPPPRCQLFKTLFSSMMTWQNKLECLFSLF
jgi:hypothetical protein